MTFKIPRRGEMLFKYLQELKVRKYTFEIQICIPEKKTTNYCLLLHSATLSNLKG